MPAVRLTWFCIQLFSFYIRRKHTKFHSCYLDRGFVGLISKQHRFVSISFFLVLNVVSNEESSQLHSFWITGSQDSHSCVTGSGLLGRCADPSVLYPGRTVRFSPR